MRTSHGVWWTSPAERPPVVEQGAVEFGSTTIHYSVVRSRRRKKTIEITLDPMEGVLVAVPTHVPADDIAAVVMRRSRWIVRRASDKVLQPHRKEFLSGESLPYLGRQVRMFIQKGTGKRATVRFRHWSFGVSVPAELEGDARREAIRRAFVRWYRRRAEHRMGLAVSRWSRAVGCEPRAVLTRDQRQRWGAAPRTAQYDSTGGSSWRSPH